MLNNPASFIFGISLTASFLAGVLALFAPCCITFLLPSYLGTIFKEQRKVMLYTLVFALGISIVLVPVALGFRFFIFFFDAYHKQTYYIGALFLIFMGIMTLKPIFHLPQIFHVQANVNRQTNVISAFGLGFMSGLTSSCCAPVLFAAVTLTSLSPTLFQALVVSLSYVFGIVFPLFAFSLIYEKSKFKLIGQNRQKIYRIFKILGAAIFILSGILIAIFNFFNKIEMYQMEGYSKSVRIYIFETAKLFRNPIIDVLSFFGILIVFIVIVVKLSHENPLNRR